MAVLGSTSLTGCDSIPSFIAAGSLVTFQQTAAPTSWTKQLTHNNKALRVVTGTATPGGSTTFTSVFASRTPAGTVSVSGGSVNNTTLSTPQIPSHTHYVENQGNGGGRYAAQPLAPAIGGGNESGGAGGGGSHTHPFTGQSASFTGTALDFAVQYVDIIICAKD